MILYWKMHDLHSDSVGGQRINQYEIKPALIPSVAIVFNNKARPNIQIKDFNNIGC